MEDAAVFLQSFYVPGTPTSVDICEVLDGATIPGGLKYLFTEVDVDDNEKYWTAIRNLFES